MKVLSLFDGVSCARLALEKASISVEKYYSSEVDKYAIKVTQANRPDTIQLGDVREVKNHWGALLNMHPDIDLLIGGSPCQDLSIAGKDRKGLDGERSGLFWEYVRILNEVKPKYFILENVASMPREAKQVITEALGVEPIMINAALVSAQNRKRLFWTNIPGVTQPEDRRIYLKDVLESDVPFDKYGIEKLKSNTVRSSGRSSGVDDKHNWDTIRIVDTRQMTREGVPRVYEGKCPTLNATMYKEPYSVVPVALRNRGDGKKPEYNTTGRANALTSVQTDSMVEENTIIRKLTPIECERLQGMTDNWTNPTGDISNSQRYKMCGNAFNVDVVAHILSFI